MRADDGERLRGQPLTTREIDVLKKIAQGFEFVAIGDSLGISHKTVAVHVQRLRAKLNARTTAQAVYVFMRGGSS
jgi:DNA-binding NarL/FixJ family response regulator